MLLFKLKCQKTSIAQAYNRQRIYLLCYTDISEDYMQLEAVSLEKGEAAKLIKVKIRYSNKTYTVIDLCVIQY